MLHIVCVQQGNYLGRGAEYVNVLHDQVRRNLAAGTVGEFVCFTDDAAGLDPAIVARPLPEGLRGWWAKLWLFSPGLFPDGDRILFFDLDTLIIGPIDDLVAYEGDFAILRDFWRPGGRQSSVMAWRSGFGHRLWLEYEAAGRPADDPGGDQAWIEARERGDTLQDVFRGIVSYKAHCHPYPPKGTRIVVFHGEPRPHAAGGWVARTWCIGGLGAVEIDVICNTETETLRANVAASVARGLPEFAAGAVNAGTLCIVGGGPTAAAHIEELRARKQNGHVIWALNGAAAWLQSHGIAPDGQWIVDARALNARFVREAPGVPRFLASQCAPETFDASDSPVTIWHDLNGAEFLPAGALMIGGGSTVGLKALAAGFVAGFRRIHLFGMDSSLSDGAHHAYSQPENDRDGVIAVHGEGVEFRSTPWMFRQAEDFQQIAARLAADGCEIHVHGHSLLAYVAAQMGRPVAADWRAQAILSRLPAGPVRGVEVGVFGGDLSCRLLQREDLTLMMVDAWEGDGRSYAEPAGDWHASLSQAQQDDYYAMALRATEFAADRRQVIRARSVEAAARVPDGSLDFAFIDADHSYEGCAADIRAWLPKVRAGGILCGHDYRNTHCPFPGVERAVEEAFGQPETGDNFTWFVRVGEPVAIQEAA